MYKKSSDFRKENRFIRNIEGLKVNSCRCFFETKPEEIKHFEEVLGFPIPKVIRTFYENYLPFTISWTFRDNEKSYLSYSGQCLFADLKEHYLGLQKSEENPAHPGERHKNVLWYEGDDPDFIRILERDYYIFDVIDFHAHYYTLLKITKEKPNPELFLFTYPNNMYPLSLDFTTYIKYADEFKGIHLWQELFIDKDKCNITGIESKRSYPLITAYKKIFPELDCSVLENAKNSSETELSYHLLSEKKSYRKRFTKINTELQEVMNDHTFVIERDTTIPCIMKAETILNRQLPDSLLAFYTDINGFKLSWRHSSVEDSLPKSYRAAETRMLPLHKVFFGLSDYDNPKKTDLFNDLLVVLDKYQQLANECYPINCNDHCVTAIRFIEESEEPELYLFSEGIPYKLSVTFEEYIESLLKTRGLSFWEFQLIDTSAIPEGELDLSNNFVNDMNELFPDTDLSDFRQE